MARDKYVQVENKNAIIELIEEGKEFERIFIASNAYKDPKTREIVRLANIHKIPIDKTSRRAISRRSRSSSKESVIGLMQIDNLYKLDDLLDEINDRGEDPFFIIFNSIRYPQNIGAIFRTAFAAGVNGVITPIQKGNLLTDEVVRISMGTCLRVPIVESNLFVALKQLQKNAVRVIGLSMDGDDIFTSDLTGPVAFLMGSEDEGVSSKMEERADHVVSIPMREGLGSLNVSVASAVVMYEKARQDILKGRK